MRQDRFRVAGQIVEIHRAAEAARGGRLPPAPPGLRVPLATRGRPETVWHILVGHQRIGVAHRQPNGLYTCGRFAEHDLRALALRLIGATGETVEELSAT